MDKVRKLTPALLKRIIAEEKQKINRQSRVARSRNSRSQRKPSKTSDSVRRAKELRILESRLRKQLDNVARQRRILKKKINQEI